MSEVPDDTPETIPLREPMVAIAVLVLIQVPPEVLLVRVMVAPGATDEGPEIEPTVGRGSTVTVNVVIPDNK